MIRYSAKFAGPKTHDTYIETLSRNQAYQVKKIPMDKGETYEVYGPKQTDISKDPESISSDLSNRSEKIGIKVPGLVEKVASDIVCAQEGEKIALESPMCLVFEPFFGKSILHVTFDLSRRNHPKTDECAHQYALLRFLWLADAIGMEIEGSPEFFIVQ
jgi:hypothetical protein